MVLTEDKDFGGLVFHRQLPTFGVVLLRLEGMSFARRADVIEAAFAEYGRRLLNSFTVISHGGVRHRPLPSFED